MKCAYLLFGLLLILTYTSSVESARKFRRQPGVINDNDNTARRRNNVDSGNGAPTRNGSPRGNMNTGSLSDRLLPVIRPSGNRERPTNRNNNGNQNFMPFTPIDPPQEVNYTVQQILDDFPWITNPQAVVASSSSNLTTSSRTRLRTSGGRRPNWTRFNNLDFLRRRFEDLDRDRYRFRVTQGVRAANGRFKVKVKQDWRELPVYGFSIVMEQENDTNLILESADGEFLSGIEEDIPSETPELNESMAIRTAIDHNRDHGKNIVNPSAKLIIYTVGDTAVLSYIINYFIPAVEPAEAEPTTTTTTTTTTTPPPRATTRSIIWRTSPFVRYHRPRPQGARSRNNRWRGRRNRCRGQCQRRTRIRRRVYGTTRPSIVTTPGIVNQPTATAAPVTAEPRTGPMDRPHRFHMAKEGSKRPWVILNANNGTVYKSWDGLTAIIRPSRVSIWTGNPVYSERRYTEIMYRDTNTDACYYQKPLGRQKFLRVNDKTSSNTANVYRFPCADGKSSTYDRTNGAASTRNSAYKWGSEAVNFLKRTSGTIWNFHMNIEAHHSGIHAVWNGNEVELGDGDPTYFYPLTTPDTVTHEVTHAFTEHNSNLEYRSQSGAINEAYSDMAATAFMDHFFNYPEHQVYKIGRTSLKFNTALRDLCNPRNPQLLLYRASQPIIINALDFTPSTDLHNASALYSKAFCELSKTAGWNIQLAFKVFTNANTIYWQPHETFNSASCGVKKAAYDLMNTNQAVRDVDRAFSFVQIACNQDWVNLVGNNI